jgi:hypothetical protein
MLELLLDEHLSPQIVAAAQKILPKVPMLSLHTWRKGHFVQAPDEDILRAAREVHMTLVTFDLKSIPHVLRRWAEQDLAHAGVVLIDNRTYRQNDIGGIANGLIRLWKRDCRLDWTNRTVFLRAIRS